MNKRWISNTPKCEIVTATQEVVELLLATNTGNRQIRPSHRQYLRGVIDDGSYVLTNQGIGVDVDGVLIDGQHRLGAIALAGFPPVQLLIVYGLPRAARSAIDLGVKRTMGDLMHFAFNRPEATSVMIAICRFWGQEIIKGGRGTKKPTPHEMLEWYTALLPAMEQVLCIPAAAKLPAPVIAAICGRLMLAPGDPRPLQFIKQVLTGANLDANSPALRLRNWLVSTRNKGSGGHVLQLDRYNKTSGALEAFLEDRPVMRLSAARRVPAAAIA